MDIGKTLEDILAEKGQALVKGKLDGDMEWWEDGTVKSRPQPEMVSNKGDETQGQKS
jgi:protein import protein ZIM17